MEKTKQDIGSGATGAQVGQAHIVNIGSNHASQIATGIPKNLTLLPPKNPNFIGRKDELKEINNSFNQDSMVYIVNGIGGIGKSELAYRYLHESEDKYDHIALFKFSKETKSLEDVLVSSLKLSLILDDSARLDQILYRLQNLSGKSLFLFDNLTSEADIKSLELLNASSDVLITTRLAITSQGYLNLDILPVEDARLLFQTYYPTDENIDDILRYVDYHSLFIELVAKTLSEACIDIEELRSRFEKGEFVKIDRDFENSFNDFLIERFKIETNEQLKELLQLLALLPSIEIETFTLDEVFANDSRLKPKLSELAKRGWLIQKGKTYKLHQIIKEFILANHSIGFPEASSIVENINRLLDPSDFYQEAIEKVHYIEVINSILNCYLEEKNPLIASLLNVLCNLQHSLARYNEAFDLQSKSLEMRIHTFGDTHQSTASSYSNLAAVCDSQGKYFEALGFAKKSLSISEESLGEEHLETARSHHEIGKAYSRQGQHSEALEHFNKSLSIRKEILGENHPGTAISYNNLGGVYFAQKKYPEALELYQKSLSISEKVFGEMHIRTASYYNNIASVYEGQEKYPESIISLHQKSILIHESTLGDKHPETAICYNNLAMAYSNQGKHTKAVKLLEKSLTIREEILGKNHPRTALAYANTSGAYLAQKKCSKALELALKALPIYQKLNLANEVLRTQNLLKTIKHRIKKAKKLPLHRRAKFCID